MTRLIRTVFFAALIIAAAATGAAAITLPRTPANADPAPAGNAAGIGHITPGGHISTTPPAHATAAPSNGNKTGRR